MAPEERDLRGVVSYQARIPVERDGEIYLIEVSLPDWEEDRVILRGLASRYGVGTVGEVMSEVEGRGEGRVVRVGAGEREGRVFSADAPLG